MCTLEYRPVWAYRNIQCFVAPCDNYETMSNACSACADEVVLGYTNGACVCGPYRP